MKFLDTKYKDLTGEDISMTSINISSKSIDSLEGAPEILRGDFHAYTNDLENLKFAPKEIYGEANFTDNLLTSLKGSLVSVMGNLDLSDNKLQDFQGDLRKVTGNLYVKSLRSFHTMEDIEQELMRANIVVGGNVVTDWGEFKQDPKKIESFAKGNRIGYLGDFL